MLTLLVVFLINREDGVKSTEFLPFSNYSIGGGNEVTSRALGSDMGGTSEFSKAEIDENKQKFDQESNAAIQKIFDAAGDRDRVDDLIDAKISELRKKYRQ